MFTFCKRKRQHLDTYIQVGEAGGGASVVLQQQEMLFCCLHPARCLSRGSPKTCLHAANTWALGHGARPLLQTNVFPALCSKFPWGPAL